MNYEKKRVCDIQLKSADKQEERGMAIILTMGILSMLLVIALAFASNARTDRKAAAANANQTQAKLLAESAVNRVVALMQNYDNAMFSHCDNNTHPGSLNTGTNDWIHHLAVTDYYGTEIFAWYKNSVYDQINWEYILADEDGDGTGDRITGRIAYVVKPGGGVDPTSYLENAVDESVGSEVRRGVDTHEMNIASLRDPGNTLHSPVYGSSLDAWNGAGTTQRFGFTNGSGTLSIGSTWGNQTFTVMYDATHVNVSTANRVLMDQWFVETTKASDEAFWIDHNDTDSTAPYGNSSAGEDNVIDAPYELFHRFNLARTVPQWDAILVSDILDDGAANTLGGNPYEYPSLWSGGTHDGDVIPWLANWKDAGTFTDNTSTMPVTPAKKVRAQQIVANLIDYCDSDDIPTSDVAPATWSNIIIPTYTGNEKTQYINELYCKLQVTQIQKTGDFDGEGDTDDTKNQYDVKVDLFVETVDMYGGSADVDVFVTGALTFTYKHADGSADTTQPVPISGQITSVADTTGLSFNQRVQTIYPVTQFLDAVYVEDAAGVPPEITSVTLTITSIVIKEGGVGVDYSLPDGATVHTVASLGTGNGTFYATFDYEIVDPRQNLNDADWSNPATNSADKTNEGAKSLGSNNSISDPSSSLKDKESVNSVIGISTAFIANAPIISPWELGCIHRGATWETLNLKMYNMEQATTGGGSAYTETALGKMDGGDANILDQIKMTNAAQTPLKVSFKVEQSKDILYSLLDKIVFGDDFTNIGTPGAKVTGAPVSNVVNGIIGASPNFFSRACVAQVTELHNGTFATQDTDAKQEELIGKFINLTSVDKSDYFTIIVLAQAIKDVGGPTGTPITIYKDLDADGGIDGVGGHPDSVVETWDIDGMDDSHTGKYDDFDDFKNDTLPSNCETIAAELGRYDQYADEIVGEQKIFVRIYRDPTTKKIQVLHYEYLED